MRSRFVRALAVCALVSVLAAVLSAAISVPTGTPYSQTFDSLGIPANTTTAAALPADFRVDNPASVRTLGTFTAALTATARGGGANLSSSAANGIYNFGAGTAALGGSDRAVGFLSSGTATQSGNLYVQLANNTGGDLTGLTISYNVEKYRLGINPAGFCIQLYYSSTGAAPWTSAGPSFLTTFGQDGGTVNSGYATAPGDAKAITNQTLSVPIPSGSNIYLAWNYSVCGGSTTTNAQALAIDDISVLGVSASNSTSPTGTMSASPSSVSPGDSITFTANVIAGTNPSSTGLTVTADLTSVGLGTPTFTDQGGGVFRFTGTIPSAVTGGAKTVTAAIADDQHRLGTTAPPTTVTILTPTSPTGTGSSNPATVAPGGSTTLTVNVTPGANPASTGVTVTGDLSAIGGSSTPFTDNGGNSFSVVTTVANGTTDGSKTLPISITDAQGRNGAFNLALNVATPFSGSTVRVSQVYGGGGNSGATFTNDFVELFNQGTAPVDLANWTVQVASAGATSPWNVTPLCPAGPCLIQPGHYFLVQEAIGSTTSVQVPLPAADAFGTIAMSAASAKVALVANSTPLAGSCPAGGAIVDMVGYGSASCFETAAAAGLGNTTADVRTGNGCIDTDNNSVDFVADSPIPRNSGSPAHICGDATHLHALGLANPQGVERGGLTTLAVHVFAAGGGSTAGYSVVGDLSSLGGSATQQFFDDASNGDLFANDGTFSVQIRLPQAIAKGTHGVTATVSDGTGGTVVEPMTMSAILPTCGTERWAVKVGDDVGAPQVDLTNPVPTTIEALRGLAVPAPLNPNPPYDPRFQGSAEFASWVLNATMTLFKKETDVDYHIVLSDTSGTIVSEIPEPDCASDASPFRPGIAAARAAFDARLIATPNFQSVSIPVRVTGVGFFDFLHGQTGVAPNGIEIHPIVDIVFQSVTTTAVTSSANPSTYQDGVDVTAAVSSTGPVPTGQVTFFDGGSALAALNLDAQGHATFHTSTLAVGQHSITASYSGDEESTASRSPVLTQTVNPADQTITFDPIAGRTFGDADFTLNATSTSGLGVSLAVASGPATLAGTTVHITGAGTVVVRASQAGDGNFNPAPNVDRSFTVAKASQAITFATPAPTPRYGALPFEVMASGGGSGNPVSFSAHGACTATGQNGIATVTIVSGGECDVVASQAGNDNYAGAPDATEVITIGRATADAKGKPVTVVYDGQPHGLTGKAVGVFGEDLTSLLNLGATFTNVPGGTANWSFAGNANYLPLSGSETVTITPAAPILSSLSAPTIEAGTATTTIAGVIGATSLIPSGTVGITLGAITLQAPINPTTGAFSATFATGSLTVAHGPYGVTFAYAGDTNFNGATGSSSVTVVDSTPPLVSALIASPNVLGPPNHKLIDVLVGYTASDVSGAPVCALTVSSNEPVNGTGDGNTSSDWTIVDAHHVALRAERAGTGSGRVYTITATCSDAYGHSTSNTTTVAVPK